MKTLEQFLSEDGTVPIDESSIIQKAASLVTRIQGTSKITRIRNNANKAKTHLTRALQQKDLDDKLNETIKALSVINSNQLELANLTQLSIKGSTFNILVSRDLVKYIQKTR